jgi:hypothetical protein
LLSECHFSDLEISGYCAGVFVTMPWHLILWSPVLTVCSAYFDVLIWCTSGFCCYIFVSSF